MNEELNKDECSDTGRRGFLKGLGCFLAATVLGSLPGVETLTSAMNPSRIALFKKEIAAFRAASSEYNLIRTQFLDGHIGKDALLAGLKKYDQIASGFTNFIRANYTSTYAKNYVKNTHALVLEHTKEGVSQLVQRKKARSMHRLSDKNRLKESFFYDLHHSNDLQRDFKRRCYLFLEDTNINFISGKLELERLIYLYEVSIKRCIKEAEECWNTDNARHLCESKKNELEYEKNVFLPLVIDCRKTLDDFEKKKRAQFELSYQVEDTSVQASEALI